MNPVLELNIQRFWPNCQKYKKCCTELDTTKMDRQVRPQLAIIEYKLFTEKDKDYLKPPKDYEIIKPHKAKPIQIDKS